MKLDHQHVLITGAAKRLGRYFAECFLEFPIALTAHYHSSEKEIRELGEQAKAKGRRFQTLRADLRSPEEITSGVEAAATLFGPIDILINSASRFYPTPALETTPEQWNDLLDTNLRGQFFFAQSAARTQSANPMVIINIGDIYSEKPLKRYAPYTASKGGLLMLTRSLAAEWAPQIRVNAISPGTVLPPEENSEEQNERTRNRTLMKRIGNPEDIFRAILFLIENDYVTGQNLIVDGGKSLVR